MIMRNLLVIILLLLSPSTFADEEPSFWNNVDKFLGKIADGVSKKDAITGLRTIDSPFCNDFYSCKICFFDISITKQTRLNSVVFN